MYFIEQKTDYNNNTVKNFYMYELLKYVIYKIQRLEYVIGSKNFTLMVWKSNTNITLNISSLSFFFLVANRSRYDAISSFSWKDPSYECLVDIFSLASSEACQSELILLLYGEKHVNSISDNTYLIYSVIKTLFSIWHLFVWCIYN
jgi:hypothetical protein